MSVPEKSAAELLATPVQFLKGVGPQRAELLQRLGLHTAAELLFFFPRDYQDLTDQREIAQLEDGKLQTIRGVVEDIDSRSTSNGTILGVLVHSGAEYLRAIWFNQPFLRERFAIGQKVVVSGKPRRNGLMWEMSHPRVETLAEEGDEPLGRILPVYPLTEGLHQWQIRKIVRTALESYVEVLDEVFPAEYLESHKLWPLRKALPQVHFPDDRESLASASRRLAYQELFVLQLALAVKRRQLQQTQGAPLLELTAAIDSRIRRLLPFSLTAGQQQAVEEIAADMGRPVPMNRLLQGDVGSGKTAVAVYAILLAVAQGTQAVMMAPTEVLARQHALTLEQMLAGSRVRCGSLTGGMAAKARQELLQQIAAGEIDVVVGTQAILQQDVQLARLGLVVIDEQHKFGVRQRSILKHAGGDPHYLVMTATPIPRTVAMTLFGDLEVSTLRASPPGRQPLNTYVAGEDKRARWWEFFRKKLREGRQGYVIVPLVDASEQVAAASLEETYEGLANGELEAFRLGLVHGRMTPAEKDAVMDAFRRGELQVLVCTSVVEVGVDVPNATLMTIETADRFGLAQLHQLRGRIARGRFPGFCCAFADPQTDEARERLDAFAASTDGFKLAEIDFRLRGPGDLFGTKQHGLPPLRFADLHRDAAILEEARRDAQELIDRDASLLAPEHALLRKMTLTRYGRALELGDVG